MTGRVDSSLRRRDSWNPTKILANVGPRGEPIAIPSIC